MFFMTVKKQFHGFVRFKGVFVGCRISSGARDSSASGSVQKAFFSTGTGAAPSDLHRWIHTVGTKPCGNAPFGTGPSAQALRHDAPWEPHRRAAPSGTTLGGNAPFGTTLRHNPWAYTVGHEPLWGTHPSAQPLGTTPGPAPSGRTVGHGPLWGTHPSAQPFGATLIRQQRQLMNI